MRIVALEEHFVLPEILTAWQDLPDEAQRSGAFGYGDDPVARRLRDLGEGRIAAMDDQGVDVQVLSLNTPGVQNLRSGDAAPVAREANDALADAVAARPDRLQGFAAIPTPDPAAAAAELERAVTRLGFRGAMLNGRTGTTPMEDRRFDDLYATAERLRAPVHLHPQLPVAPVRDAYYAGLGGGLDFAFGGPAIGWHYETGVQLLRMVLSGVFDRFPGLQVILGHWGEVVLFFLERTAAAAQGTAGLQRPIQEVFRENVWVTGSGLLSERYRRWAAEVVGLERVMTATDYPFIDNSGGAARAFVEDADLTDAEKASVASGAWERLTSRLG